MANNIQNYGVSVKADTAIKKLKNFQRLSQNFNKAQLNHLKQQRKLEQASYKAKDTMFAQQMRKQQKEYDIVQNAIKQKAITAEREKNRVLVAEGKKLYKQRLSQEAYNKVRLKESVSNLTGKDEELVRMRKHYKMLEREAKQLQKARDFVQSSALFTKKKLTAQEQALKLSIQEQVATAKTAYEVRQIYRTQMNINRGMRKQTFLQERLAASSKQYAANMLSAFAIAAGTGMVVQTGQDFEAVNNTMLAVSGNAEDAAANFEFVRQEAFRLGLGLTESAKGYAKMKAAQGDLADGDINNLFIGVSELSTVLGLSAVEAGRATNAINQMLSKGKVSAEELRLQLGEVIPTAIQDMAKATQRVGLIDDQLGINDAVAAMLKLQEQGKLISSEVLPAFGDVMRESASKGIDAAMKSNRVAMNRMFTSFQMAADDFFQSGFGDGLTNTFNSIANLVKKMQPLWKALGKIIGSVLNGLSHIIDEFVTPAMSALSSVISAITNLFGDFAGIIATVVFAVTPLGRLLGGIFRAFGGGKSAIDGITKAFKVMVFPLMTALAILEEIAEFFSPTGKKTLLGFNIDDITPKIGEGLKTVESVQGKLSPASDKGAEAYKSVYGSTKGSSFQAGGFSTIQVNTMIDSNVVASEMVQTSQFQEAVNDKISESGSSSYD